MLYFFSLFLVPIGIYAVSATMQSKVFSFSVDGLVWTRSDPSQQLLAYNQNTAKRVLQTSDLDFGAKLGYQFEADFWINQSLKIRAIYSRGHWDKLDAKIQSDPNVVSPFFLSRITQNKANIRSKLVDADVAMSLDIFESIFLTAGPRYFYFREEMDINQAFPNANSVLDYQISAKNNLIGLQVGMELNAIFKELVNIGFGIKAGGALNIVQQKSRADLSRFFQGSQSEKNKRSGAGFLEADVSIAFQMTKRMYIKTAYDAILISGLATTSNNLSQTLLQNNSIQASGLTDIGLNTQGQIIFTKGLVGLEWKW